jgi:hypothetical protein
MTSKLMIVGGLTWFAVVVLWLFLRFDLVWGNKGLVTDISLLVNTYVALFVFPLFLIGWMVPLAWGFYRVSRRR